MFGLGFFLNGAGFIGRRGGGQWLLPAYTTSTISVAVGRTAGLAKFRIVVFVDWGCQAIWQGMLVGSGMGAHGDSPGTMQEMHSICGASCCRGMTAGSGAGGSARRMTCCSVQSCCGSWHGFGCCRLSTYGRRGGMFGAGNAPALRSWKLVVDLFQFPEDLIEPVEGVIVAVMWQCH